MKLKWDWNADFCVPRLEDSGNDYPSAVNKSLALWNHKSHNKDYESIYQIMHSNHREELQSNKVFILS